MSKRNRSPEEQARREKIRELLQLGNIGSTATARNLKPFHFNPLPQLLTRSQHILQKSVKMELAKTP